MEQVALDLFEFVNVTWPELQRAYKDCDYARVKYKDQWEIVDADKQKVEEYYCLLTCTEKKRYQNYLTCYNFTAEEHAKVVTRIANLKLILGEEYAKDSENAATMGEVLDTSESNMKALWAGYDNTPGPAGEPTIDITKPKWTSIVCNYHDENCERVNASTTITSTILR